ncbi:PIN domain-containing protein [Pseudothauera nasutitermitis]|nr:PIN domain-containing protein [Pseudothauera nasutitermitis]
MNPAYFLDTNILIYATSLAADHAGKKAVARSWVARDDWGLSTQVLMEFYANARQHRHGLPPAAPRQLVAQLARQRPVQGMDRDLVLEALELRERHQISHWDAAILCAAQRIGAHTVVSEDLAHGQAYGKVTVLNPFLG